MYLALLFLGLSGARWTLTLGGDLMFNGIRPGTRPLSGLSGLFHSSSESMANLEIPLTSRGTPTKRKSAKELKARNQFVLRGNPAHVADIRDAGITCVTQANNHCMDYGAEGLFQESTNLDQAHIVHAGAGISVADAEKTAIRNEPGRPSVGLMSVMAFATPAALRKTTPATLSTPGIAVLSLGGSVSTAARAKLSRRIAVAHQGCDILVVGIHWGVERKEVPNAYQVALGRALIDCGADVVWGHHPHVLEGSEVYRGKPIIYSTGNLLSALPSDTGLFKLSFEGTRFSGAEFFPARIRAGRVRLMMGKDERVARRAYHEMCHAVLKKYPVADSVPLF